MKKTTQRCGLVLLFSFAFLTACTNEDQGQDATEDMNDVATNSFSVNGMTFNLSSQGALDLDGGVEDSGAYEMDLILVSDPTDIINGQGFQFNSTYIELEVYSNSSQNLASGRYVFNDTELAGSFDNGVYFLENSDSDGRSIDGGELMVERSGDTYTISFELIDDENRTLRGSFMGSLRVFE